MGIVIIVLLAIAALSFWGAHAVYQGQKRKGSAPWAFAIVTFIVLAGVFLLGIYIFLEYFFRFER